VPVFVGSGLPTPTFSLFLSYHSLSNPPRTARGPLAHHMENLLLSPKCCCDRDRCALPPRPINTQARSGGVQKTLLRGSGERVGDPPG